MSSSVCFLVDLGNRDLEGLPENLPKWMEIAARYNSITNAANKTSTVAFVRVEGFPLVEVAGPWAALCDVGITTLKVAPAVKWGVFISNYAERLACLNEVVSLAKACNARRFVGFANEGYGASAYELTLAGGSFDDVVRELKMYACGISIRAEDFQSIAHLSELLGGAESRLEDGFFVVCE